MQIQNMAIEIHVQKSAACVQSSYAQLPPVDPDFLVVERRSGVLHAYTRGLLCQLRRIHGGSKAEGYPIATIKRATIWLLESHAEAGVAPAPEMALLIEELLRPKPDASTLPVRRSSGPAYWAAIAFEAGWRFDPAGKKPSVATLYAVAKHVRPQLQNKHASQKTAEGTVRNWRRLPHYRENVALQRRRPLRVET